MYSLLLALIYVAFISLGLPDSLLGSGWPVMHSDLNVPISFMGIVSMVISGGTIISSILSDNCCQRISDSDCFIWFFHFKPVLDADYFRNSLRFRRRGN